MADRKQGAGLSSGVQLCIRSIALQVPVWGKTCAQTGSFSVSNPCSNWSGGAEHLTGESDKIITGAFIIVYAQS